MTRKLTAFFLMAGMIVMSSLAFAGTTELVSLSSSGAQGNGQSGLSSISADGRYVAFGSAANNLVDGDTNGQPDIFVRDRTTGNAERVNVSTAGAQANNYTDTVSISGDGRFVVFDSLADNLVTGDTNAAIDIFVHDRLTGATERVSVGPGGIEANSYSYTPRISADGRFVTFYSNATNLVPGVTYGPSQTYVYDRVNKTTELVSKSNTGIQGNGNSYLGAISADGRYIAFASFASNLVSNDTNGNYDVFVYDRVAKTIENANVSENGVQGGSAGISYAINADGRYVAFSSSGLVPGLSGFWLYVRDRQTGTIDPIAGGDGASISADGRFVTVCPGNWQVYLVDRITRTSEPISVDNSGNYGNGYSAGPSISADGSMVAFYSGSTNLVAGDTNGLTDVLIRDRSTIQIIDALFNYRTDLLTVEATSNSGAADNLSVVGFGPMTWNGATGSWQLTATNVTTAPLSITVTGNSGSRIIQ